MNDRLLFRIPIFYNDKFLGFEYHNIETGQVLTDIKDKTDCENWKFGDWEQCTGLRDKNGKLIFVGDNVQFIQKRGYYTDKGDVCTIEFGTFRFCGFGWRSRPENTVDFALTESAAKKCVIVGNIHEQKD